MTVLHVATTGSDESDGSVARPLQTINHAAALARPGDTVTVHEGVYREWVKPRRGGLSDLRRITYQAAPGEHVIITGAEVVVGWELVRGTVWKVEVSNSVFGPFNPFAEEIEGDFIVHASPDSPRKHLGDVYLNGRSFHEVTDSADLEDPPTRTEIVDDWTGARHLLRDPDQTRFVWHALVGAEITTIQANFQGADPNEEHVEINVRRSVFAPVEHHLNYITVRGFELAQAATPWAPPTADQPGLIGPNWAKGWVIEHNVIRDAKASGISLGKESSTGHNFASERGDKPGYRYQLESVFAASHLGWDREHVGSHIVRRNTIFACGQNAIVGNLGCVFSTIEDNHIYDIAAKREFYGHEIAGIKLHAPIDVVIRRNRIHDCSLGIWLDWQTQGTRISRNVFYANNRDLFIEVSHGPYVVDHNVFASRASLENFSQGGAFLNNLFCGSVSLEPVEDRPTPYHVPHSTQVAGYAAILGGDDRVMGNIFLGGELDQAYGATKRPLQVITYGTAGYDAHPSSLSDYLALVDNPALGDHERFAHVKQPTYISDNVYGPGASHYAAEQRAHVLTGEAWAEVFTDETGVYLHTSLPDDFSTTSTGAVSGAELPRVLVADADFEDATGGQVLAHLDLVGVKKMVGQRFPAGPLAALTSGVARHRLW